MNTDIVDQEEWEQLRECYEAEAQEVRYSGGGATLYWDNTLEIREKQAISRSELTQENADMFYQSCINKDQLELENALGQNETRLR